MTVAHRASPTKKLGDNDVMLLTALLPLLCTASLVDGDTWAVLVGTSRFWHNYRHTSNVLAVYRALRQQGLPDSNIVLMVAEEHACDPRNPRRAEMFASAGLTEDLCGT